MAYLNTFLIIKVDATMNRELFWPFTYTSPLNSPALWALLRTKLYRWRNWATGGWVNFLTSHRKLVAEAIKAGFEFSAPKQDTPLTLHSQTLIDLLILLYVHLVHFSNCRRLFHSKLNGMHLSTHEHLSWPQFLTNTNNALMSDLTHISLSTHPGISLGYIN